MEILATFVYMKLFLYLLPFIFVSICITREGVASDPDLQELYKKVAIVEDVKGNKSIEDLLSDSSVFTKKEGIYSGNSMQGNTKVYWLSFVAFPPTGEKNYLEIKNYYADTIQVFVTDNQHRLLATALYGYRIPDTNSLFESNSYFFLLPKSDSIRVYIRLCHRLGPSFSCLNIGTQEAFYARNSSQLWMTALYFGAIAMMLLYNAFLWIFTRDQSYFYYVFYSFTVAIYIAAINGLLHKFMGNADWWVYQHLFTLICVSNISGCLFALNFLKLRFYSHYLYKIMYVVIFFAAFIGLIDYIVYPLHLLWLELLSAVNSLLVLLSAYWVYKKGYKPAKFYLIASLSMIMAVLFVAFTQLRIIPNIGLSPHLLQIGAVAEMALFSIALADKINLYKTEKEEAVLRKEFVQLESERKQAEYKLIALKAQIKPHFIFNTINSIQHFVLESKPKEAYYYMEKFASLIRNTLHLSDSLYVTLKDELDNLRIYLEIESLRFGHSFQYKFDIAENVSLADFTIQPLLIQPLVENAIWHGLLQKKGERLLTISVWRENDQLFCSVEDNGIGRKKSKEINQNKNKIYDSKGLAITMERLAMNNSGNENCQLEIIDLTEEDGNAIGTKAVLSMKIV